MPGLRIAGHRVNHSGPSLEERSFVMGEIERTRQSVEQEFVQFIQTFPGMHAITRGFQATLKLGSPGEV